jgi:hypothetical protein
MGATAADEQAAPHPARQWQAINSGNSNPGRNEYHLYRRLLLIAQKIIHHILQEPYCFFFRKLILGNTQKLFSVIAGLTRDLSIIIEIPDYRIEISNSRSSPERCIPWK